MTDIPLRDQIARIIADEGFGPRRFWYQQPVAVLVRHFDTADALLAEFEILPRPGKEPRP